jgi:hypothetical protein
MRGHLGSFESKNVKIRPSLLVLLLYYVTITTLLLSLLSIIYYIAALAYAENFFTIDFLERILSYSLRRKTTDNSLIDYFLRDKSLFKVDNGQQGQMQKK